MMRGRDAPATAGGTPALRSSAALRSTAPRCVYSFSAMTSSRFCFALLLLLLFILILASSPVIAQDRVAAAVDSLPSVKKIDQVAISPDGMQVAYSVDGQLFVATVVNAGATAHSIAADQKLEARDVTWSADSRRIAWLADLPGEAPASQLWTASADGRGLVKLADLKGYAEAPRYSPDGTKIAVLYIGNMPRIAGPLQPMTPLAGVVGEKIFEQRLAVLDLGTKKLTQVTPSDVYVYEYDWMPDSRGWVAIAAHGSGDNNWWIARLYAVDAQGGKMQEIYAEVADRGAACFSGWKERGIHRRIDERCRADRRGRLCCADNGRRCAQSDARDSCVSIFTGVDCAGSHRGGGECGWEFGIRGGCLRRGLAVGASWKGWTRRRNNRRKCGCVGSRGFVVAGWIGERGGAAGGEYSAGSMGRNDG